MGYENTKQSSPSHDLLDFFPLIRCMISKQDEKMNQGDERKSSYRDVYPNHSHIPCYSKLNILEIFITRKTISRERR